MFIKSLNKILSPKKVYLTHKELPTKVKTSHSQTDEGLVDVEFKVRDVFDAPYHKD